MLSTGWLHFHDNRRWKDLPFPSPRLGGARALDKSPRRYSSEAQPNQAPPIEACLLTGTWDQEFNIWYRVFLDKIMTKI